jgi:hypothetical protein
MRRPGSRRAAFSFGRRSLQTIPGHGATWPCRARIDRSEMRRARPTLNDSIFRSRIRSKRSDLPMPRISSACFGVTARMSPKGSGVAGGSICSSDTVVLRAGSSRNDLIRLHLITCRRTNCAGCDLFVTQFPDLARDRDASGFFPCHERDHCAQYRSYRAVIAHSTIII